VLVWALRKAAHFRNQHSAGMAKLVNFAPAESNIIRLTEPKGRLTETRRQGAKRLNPGICCHAVEIHDGAQMTRGMVTTRFTSTASARKASAVPRHREVIEFTARKICKDLGVPRP
jgi:hypothetical protein